MNRLAPDENELVGHWVLVDTRVVGDATCERVEWLTAEVLEIVGTSESGWETLFRDPSDGRYWERTYPRSELHGGGPPTLRCLTEAEASRKYLTA